MLNSRYLHLHEALGLGSMWLKRGAKISPTAPAMKRSEQPLTTITQATTPSTLPSQEAPKVSQTHQISNARLAAVAAAGAQTNMSSNASQADMALEKNQSLTHTQNSFTKTNDLNQFHAEINLDIKTAELMVISICPSLEDNINGQLFSDDVGILLNNMLAAISLKPHQVYKTSWLKGTLTFESQPEQELLTSQLPIMQTKLKMCKAKALLLLGQIFAQNDQLQNIQKLCGQTPYFIIPHPARILRQPQLKAAAWQELKKLRQVLQSSY